MPIVPLHPDMNNKAAFVNGLFSPEVRDPTRNGQSAAISGGQLLASTHRNTFMQLEGWPAQWTVKPPGGTRHNADFAANGQTLWNFATYGASVHSEKRSTPIFLAGSTFDLTPHPDTGMPYYWGANAGNVGDAWMHPDLVTLGA